MAQSDGKRRDKIAISAGGTVSIDIGTIAASSRRKKTARGFNRGLPAKWDKLHRLYISQINEC
jgi:hypothetical protein